jgi:hypothetical protein
MSVQLTKEQLQDKIFELEMELKELTMRLDAFELENKFYMDTDCLGGIDTTELEFEIQATICYIQYYQAGLQYIEDLKYES